MPRKIAMIGLAAAALLVAMAGAQAQSTVKIGVILPMTGPQQSTGVQISAAIRLYMAQHGDTVAGKKIEVVYRDSGAVAENAKRLAQELIVNDKVNLLAGFGVTPTALAVAPLATEAKVPQVVMAAGTSIITERSPFIVRTSFTLPQSSVIMARWALMNGIRKVVSLVSDYAPGIDSENAFKQAFINGGGTIPEFIHVPLANPDFAPFLQRARDAQARRGLHLRAVGAGRDLRASSSSNAASTRPASRSSARATSPTTTCSIGMGDPVIGTVTAHIYSAAHPSQMNKDYVAAFRKANNDMRPNFMSVGGYDGMHLIYEALKKTGGNTRRRPGRGDEGHGVGEPARPHLDRSGNPRHHPERLYAQGREGRRRALQCRVRDIQCRQGPRQDQEVRL